MSLRSALAVALFAFAPGAFAQVARFAELISKFGAERCAEVSYFESYERDSIYEYWDARCASGREYRILLPLIAQAKAEAVPCESPGAPPIDCFRRAQRRRDMPEHVDLFTMRARSLIEGRWLGATALEVQGDTVSWPRCRNVPAAIVRDSVRPSVETRTVISKSGSTALRYSVAVREIALALERDAKCRHGKDSLGEVIVFPITNIGLVEATEASCSARLRVYRTRGDFDRAKPAAEIPLRRDKCEYAD